MEVITMQQPIILVAGRKYVAGTILSRAVTAATLAAEPSPDYGKPANKGDGEITDLTYGHAVQRGAYRVLVFRVLNQSQIADFRVSDPDNRCIGLGATDQEFRSRHLTFWLRQGSKPFAVGDRFGINVVAVTDQYAEVDPSAADGREVVAGILAEAVDASEDAASGTMLTAGPFRRDRVVWPLGAGQAQITPRLHGLGIHLE
jgi:hypothetical protein